MASNNIAYGSPGKTGSCGPVGPTGIYGGTGLTGLTGMPWTRMATIVYKDSNFELTTDDLSNMAELVKTSPAMFEALERLMVTYRLVKKETPTI